MLHFVIKIYTFWIFKHIVIIFNATSTLFVINLGIYQRYYTLNIY